MRPTAGDFGRNAIRRLPLLNGLVHVSLVGLELRQRVMLLDHVKRLLSGQLLSVQWVEPFFEAVHHVRERLLADPTDLAQVLGPADGFGKFLKEEICDDLPRDVNRKAQRALGRKGKVTVYTHALAASRGGLVFRQNPKDGVADHGVGRVLEFDDPAHLSWRQPLKRLPQFNAQRRRVHFSNVSALVGVRIDGFLSSKRCKILAVFQPVTDQPGFGGGTNDDDLQRDHGGLRSLPGARGTRAKYEGCPGNEKRGNQAPVIVRRHRDRFAENSDLIADNNRNDVQSPSVSPCTLCHNNPRRSRSVFI